MAEIIEYTGKSKRQVDKELKELTASFVFYKVDEISREHLGKAVDMVKDIDINDSFFVALHLHTGHKIWTGDTKLINGLKKKGFDICITTSELKKSLYRKR